MVLNERSWIQKARHFMDLPIENSIQSTDGEPSGKFLHNAWSFLLGQPICGRSFLQMQNQIGSGCRTLWIMPLTYSLENDSFYANWTSTSKYLVSTFKSVHLAPRIIFHLSKTTMTWLKNGKIGVPQTQWGQQLAEGGKALCGKEAPPGEMKGKQ